MDFKKIVDRKLIYSAQACELLKKIDDKELNFEELETFCKKEFFVIGGSHILSYFEWLARLEKESTKAGIPTSILKEKYLNRE